MGWLDGITYSMNLSLSKLWDTVKDRDAWHAVAHGLQSPTRLTTEQQQRGTWASQVVQWSGVCLPAQETQEMWVQSLSHEDPIEEEMATRSRIRALTVS